MAKLTLSAQPCHYRQNPGSRSRALVFQIGCGRLRRVEIEARNLSEIEERVAEFGASTAEAHPGVSFQVSINVAPGSRAPSGFNTKSREYGAFGSDAWMHTREV